jgi:hypothetical protein
MLKDASDNINFFDVPNWVLLFIVVSLVFLVFGLFFGGALGASIIKAF